jgi:hypothetical protein
MKIGSEENFVELEVQLECDSSLPSYGDALISIVVSSNGYHGKNQVWVSQQELKEFGEALSELEINRKGWAILTSISPGELYLKIYAYDGLGHLAIEGEIGYVVTGLVNFKHSGKFGFTIDSEHLVNLAKVKRRL